MSEQSYIELFFDAHKPLAKPRFVCVEEDWVLCCNVFPEPGFRSYFLGHIISKLANELRQQGIDSYFKRSERSDLANVTQLMSHIRIIGSSDCGHDRRGIGGEHGGASDCPGIPTSAAQPVGGETEEGKEDGANTGLTPA